MTIDPYGASRTQVFGAHVGAPLLALLSAVLLFFTAAWGLLKSPKYLPLTLSPRRSKALAKPANNQPNARAREGRKAEAEEEEETPQGQSYTKRPQAMVVVDPFSTGAVLAQMISDRGYQVVRIVSADFSDEIMHMLPAACSNLSFAATIQVNTTKSSVTRRPKRR